MNNPVFFSETNTISENDAKTHAKKLKPLLQWQDNEEILDVGCGIGNVTRNVILPMVPNTFKQITAFDVSDEMLQFTEKYSHPRIKYMQHDISSKPPEEFEAKFDHIFSFYCLHWVKNQRAVFANLSKMLKPGGQMMLTIIAESSNYCVLKDLLKMEKWSSYMHDLDEDSFPYQFCDSPKDLLEMHLQANNFKIHYIDIETRAYKFTRANFEKFIIALNPYVKNIPISEQNEFVDSYLERIMKLKTVETGVNKTGEAWATFTYQAMSVLVSKP